MKAYKLDVLIIDFDDLGPKEIQEVIENGKYPNWCISPNVKMITEADIGEWTDNHPLNIKDTCDAEYARLFGKGGS